jgi:hypothetical protein
LPQPSVFRPVPTTRRPALRPVLAPSWVQAVTITSKLIAV